METIKNYKKDIFWVASEAVISIIALATGATFIAFLSGGLLALSSVILHEKMTNVKK